MADEWNDKRIISEILQGNENMALKQLTYKYSNFKSLSQWIINKSGDQVTAEDIKQEALIVFYKNVKNGKFVLNDNINIQSYIIGIGKNLWHKALRTRIRRKQREEMFTSKPIDNALKRFNCNKQLIEISYDELENYLYPALKELNSKCQKLLIDFYIKKLPLKELAKVLGITYDSSRTTIKNCRKSLHKILCNKLLAHE